MNCNDNDGCCYAKRKNMNSTYPAIASALLMAFALVIIIVLLIISSHPAYGLRIISPQSIDYNTTTINVKYIVDVANATAGASCTATTDNNITFKLLGCNNFTITAHIGYNSIILNDGRESVKVEYSVMMGSAGVGQNQNYNSVQLQDPIQNSSPSGGYYPPFNQSSDNINDISGMNNSEINPEYSSAIITDIVASDEPHPIAGRFTKDSPSTGSITVERMNYDYPAGVSFKVLAKIHNSGSTDLVNIVPATLHADIISITRIDTMPQNEDIAIPIVRVERKKSCDENGCEDIETDQVVGMKTQKIRKYSMNTRKLSFTEGLDKKIDNIKNKRDRAPKNAKAISAQDIITPGTDAYYEITFRAGSNPSDEFFIHALSDTMAEGLDPFISSNWSYSRPIYLNETYGVARNNQLVFINITDIGNDEISNCTKEIRVSNNTMDDVPVRVIYDGANLTSGKYCTITFGAKTTAWQNLTYYVYWGNPDATAPVAATDKNLLFNNTWTPSEVYFNSTDFGTTADTSDWLAPSVVDYDCDGVIDLVYGIDDGVLWWRKNSGTNSAPIWEASVRVGSFDVGTNSNPTFGDLFSNNGILDLIVGENTAGAMNYYENTGTCASPTWVARTVVNGSLNIGANTAPTIADFDNDGLLDVLWGSANTFFNSTKNTNNSNYPSFAWNALPIPPTVAGTYKTPTIVDLNFDGLLDIVSGNNGGTIFYFQNNGTIGDPEWFYVGNLRFNMTTANIDVGSYSVPSIYDINEDGWKDMIIGEYAGFISVNTAVGSDGKYLINAPLDTENGSTNIRPDVLYFNMTPDIAFKNDTLNCSINFTDMESDNLTVNFTWRKNNVIQNNLNSSIICYNATLCSNNVTINWSMMNYTNNWSCTALLIDDGWRLSFTENRTIQNYVSQSEFIMSEDVVVLNAGFRKNVGCNISITDYDSNSTFNMTSAVLYLEGTDLAAADNNITHYTNNSCVRTANTVLQRNYSCTFNLQYFTANGTWLCNARINDTWSIYNQSINFTIDPLYAINVTQTLLDFGKLGAGEISSNISLNMTNIGNNRINISVYGYGTIPGDNNGFTCKNGNITPDIIRFSSNISSNFSQKINLSNVSQPLYTSIPSQSNNNRVSNLSYWQVGIPEMTPALGECNGTIVLQAEFG